MRKCTRCKEIKNDVDFPWENKDLNRKGNKCFLCRRLSNKEHYAKNKVRYQKQSNASRREGTEWKIAFLKNKKCVDCGETDLRVLDFDHIDPTTKTKSLSALIQRHASIDTLEEEAAKCVIRCANCHRKRTAEQYGWFNWL